ncbi:MAG TPA: hypothetical protein VMD27_08760 [Candidatus Aquilonibacter sp.]|nr:hypothetical protein [Candidatus Aquilonibacter sp.]
MSYYDYAVIAIYLVFVACIGLVFKKFSKNSSDFFRGGGNVLWWMVGAMAFMSQFSSWTFIGAANKAYTDGFLVLAIYLGNGLGAFIAYLWSAKKFRQMRVVTPMEGVRDRFGKFNEQFFTWVWIPIGIVYAAIWLYSVSTFVSTVFGMNMTMTIVVVGMVVLIVSFLGGAWAVVASAFLQMVILMCLTLVTAVLSIQAVGHHYGSGGFLHSVSAFFNHLPSNYLHPSETHRMTIVWLWIAAFFLKQICTSNDMKDADRFLCAKDSKNASRASLLAAILFTIGPIIWFIPPMAAKILYPDLAAVPQLHGLPHPADGAYVAIGINYMPVGMIGLMMSAIFAATMANMDTGLNKNAAIFVQNFYRPLLRKHASEAEYMVAGRVSSFVFGILIIVAAYIISLLGSDIFDVMNSFSAMVALPFIMPLIWGIVIKRTPPWAGWSTVLVGFLSALIFKSWSESPVIFQHLVGLGSPLQKDEMADYTLIGGTFVTVIATSVWFLSSALFAQFNSPEYTKQEEEFFERLHTPVVISDPEQTRKIDYAQLNTVAWLSIPYGGFVMLLAAIPNPFEGRLAFICCGVLIVGVGLLLRWKGKKLAPPPASKNGA